VAAAVRLIAVGDKVYPSSCATALYTDEGPSPTPSHSSPRCQSTFDYYGPRVRTLFPFSPAYGHGVHALIESRQFREAKCSWCTAAAAASRAFPPIEIGKAASGTM